VCRYAKSQFPQPFSKYAEWQPVSCHLFYPVRQDFWNRKHLGDWTELQEHHCAIISGLTN
jgi:hypothetical protein